ncbi:tetratricopeptide repeat protein [Salipaludibacillus sp. CUR1]|uniref:tetratricopeptide repeat protein n=1 Tax=Salipaludibacillus sp. CUR1 TaxID=2820003 RepID=UPI001E3FBC2C|nr:tetratricopeptide repeat protein [Salipaludibacillus sp. CUR1]MCE7793124.1 tetratricopeptide repeat protein [Salipaludibacillus sp. CUR1]
MPGIETKEKKGQVIPFIQDGGYFYKKGIEAYQNQQIERAVQYFKRAIRVEPEEPVFSCQLAIVLSERGEYEASNDYLTKIKTDIDPSMSECYFFLANNMAHLGKLEEAKENLEVYLKIDEEGEFSEDAESLLDMVNNQLRESGEKVIPAKEKLDDFHFIGLLNSGRYAEAEEEARKQMAAVPSHWNLYVYLAEALMYQNRQKEAEQILKDLLVKDEPNFLAQCQMAVLLYQNNDPQASVWISNIINLRPMDHFHCYFLGRSLLFAGEYQKAYEWYAKLLNKKLLPGFHDFYHQMALLSWHTGNKEAARNLWVSIESEEPEKKQLTQTFIKEIDNGNEPPRDISRFLYR